MHKKHGGWREWCLLILTAICFLLALLSPLTFAVAEAFSSEEQQLLDSCRTGEIIRLHVVANSDSKRDQAIKLAVRDAVIDAFGEMIITSAAADCETLYTALQSHQEAIQAKARDTACALGFRGTVTAQVGWMELPEKNYGRVTLPAGTYRGLRIVLGSGSGQNWWCVLFPQLCLALSSESTAEAQPVWNSIRVFQNWLLLPQ